MGWCRMTLITGIAPVVAITMPAAAQQHAMAGMAQEVGLSPIALAASGVTAIEAATMLATLEQAVAARSELLQAKAAVEAAHGLLDASVAQLQADPSNIELRQIHDTRRIEFRAAGQLVESKRTSLRELAVGGLTPQTQGRIARFVARAGFKIPNHFRLAEIPETRLAALEQAVLRRQRAERTSTALAPGHSELLALVEADSEVVAAQQRLSTTLSAIQQVFGQ